MEKKGGIKAARPRRGTISASWSAGRTNAAAQGIVKPAWADASVERGLASQWPRFGARVVALWVWEAQKPTLRSHQESGIGKKATPCDDHRLEASKATVSSRLLSATGLTWAGWRSLLPGLQGCQISVFSSVWRPRGLRTPHRVWTPDPHLAVIQAGPTAWRRLKFVGTLICREGKPFRAEGVQQSEWQRGWQRLVLKCTYPRTISSENTAISNGIGRPADCRLPGPTATALMLDCRAACRDPSHHESDPVRGLDHPA